MIENTRNLRDEVMLNPRAQQQQSWQWYQRTVRNAAAGMSAQKFLGDNISHQTTRIVPGTMCLFFYDPKTKDELPYYDNFPLCIPFAADGTHFTGLNMHYLHPRTRMTLLEKLTNIREDRTMNDKDKMNFTWATIKNVSKFPEVQHCVKQYLFGHVKSRFIVVPPTDWKFTIWLPLEKFRKATNEQVWRNSRT